MDTEAHLDAIRLESDRFAEAAGEPLVTRVPSCPEWSLGDLVWHLGGVQRFWAEVVRTRTTDRSTVDQPADVPDDELRPWYREVSAGLVQALVSTDPSVRVWSWAGGQQDVAWVARRQAHEVAVHRWDAQNAVGRAEEIAPALAADGIGEFFEWMFGPEDVAEMEGVVGVQLAPTDGDAVWNVCVRDGAIDLAAEVAAIDVTVRGNASDLLLLLWRRVHPDDVEIEGDRMALERFLSLVDLS